MKDKIVEFIEELKTEIVLAEEEIKETDLYNMKELTKLKTKINIFKYVIKNLENIIGEEYE